MMTINASEKGEIYRFLGNPFYGWGEREKKVF
jgi:hypothetical protein